MVLFGKTFDRYRWNENLRSNSAYRETSGGDEVIDGANAEAERFGGVSPGIQQFFYSVVHAASGLGRLASTFLRASLLVQYF